MNIAVCVKQVPQSANNSFVSATNTLERNDENQMNPSDVYALETALHIKDRQGGEVAVLTMGRKSATSLLVQAAALGADGLYLLSDEMFAGSDTYATAKILCAAISQLQNIDLVICGRRAVDGETGQVGPEIAAVLNLPCITNVSGLLSIDENLIVCKRLTETGYDILELTLPALITVCEGVEGVEHPRLSSIFGMRRAKNAPITLLTNEQLALNPASVGLSGSPTKVERVTQMARSTRHCILEDDIKEAVRMAAKKIAGVAT